jgi:1-acyl-sn-glycerol-3-phosphate acyltransferase
MVKWIAKFIFQTLWGWRYSYEYPKEVKKSVIMVMPHTSNWDFSIGIFTRPILDLDTRFVAKNSLFWFPLGIIMRALGGVAVDRSKNTNFVDAVAALYEGKESFKITLTPEGTRSKVHQLKSGFYYIALKAKVPIVMCKFDWGKKEVGFSKPFYPTGNYEADLPKILSYFKGVKGKNPEKDFDFESVIN